MSAYHQAAFTLDPVVEIELDAAPAIGVEQAGTAEAIQQASIELVEESGVRLTASLAGSEVTFTLEPAEDFIEPYTIEWDFGNGRHETGHDLVQRADYLPGSYVATATIIQPNRPSLAPSAAVLV